MRLSVFLLVIFVIAEVAFCVWILSWLIGGRLSIAAGFAIGIVSSVFFVICVAAVRAASLADDASDELLERHANDD